MLNLRLVFDVQVNPVFTTDGHTYEQGAIEAWLVAHDTSPLTNQRLQSKQLTPNQLARSQLMALREANS